MKRFLALLLCFAMIFAFAACKKDAAKEDDTTVADATEAVVDGEVADDATEAADGETEAEVETNEDGETVEAPAEDATDATKADGKPAAKPEAGKPDADKPAAAPTAPVNGSKAAVVKYFNQEMTALKQFKGKVVATRTQGTQSKINSIDPKKIMGKDLAEIAAPLLPNDYPTKETKTFNGGKSGSETFAHFLPANDLKAFNLNAAGVASASCVKSGAGYKVTVKLVAEKGSGLTFVPTYHSQIFDTLSLSNDDFKPFTPKGTTVQYLGGTFSFTTDAQGRIVSINLMEPAIVDSGLAIFGVEGIHANFNGDWKQIYSFKY